MNEEHFKALSALLRTCREAEELCDDIVFIRLIAPIVESLEGLRLEWDWTMDCDDEDLSEVTNRQTSASEDNIQKVFLLLQQKDEAYGRLKRLYDVRLEVTRDALAKNRVEMATLRSRLEETENHLRWSYSRGPDPDVF